MIGTILAVVLGVLLAAIAGLWIFGERGRLLRPSTWKSLQGAGLKNLLSVRGIHGYVYGRWSNQYLNILINHIFPRLGERGKRWWRNHYHAKVLTPDQAESIIVLEQDISLRDLEQVIPYSMARDLVLKGPPDVAVYECGCRHVSAQPCQPTQVCMMVGQPFVDFVLEHNPQSSRRISQTEALALLRAEHERGHIHTAWFKDALFNRFYAICNCCKCCCGGIKAMVQYGNPMIASSGYVSEVDEAQCTSCGLCVETCSFGALSINGSVVVSWEKCMGCGVCVDQCSSQALTLIRDERKGIPLDVRLIIQHEKA